MKIIVKPKHFNITKGGEKRMRYSKIILPLGMVVLVLATLAFLSNTWARENVRMTKHNLSANPNITASNPSTTEVCIYCHTPHGGRTDVAGGAAPIWNRALSSVTSYDMYNSPNFDLGTNNRGSVPRGVSVACLSCHDGTVAFDALINAQGSGGYNAANAGLGGTSIGHNLNGPFVDQNDKSFGTAAEPFPNLGINLSNDHPISMRICSGNNAHDPQFTEACTNSSSPANNPNILRVSRSGVFPSDIRDSVRAYKSEPTSDTDGWYVECASCHNPHEASRPGDADGTNATTINNSRFLRLPAGVPGTIPQSAQDALTDGDRNAGSLLCLSCHQK